METLLVLLAVGAGALGAVLLRTAASRREREAEQARRRMPRGRAAVGAALLREIAAAGEASPDEARAAASANGERLDVRRIDLASWAEAFADGATEEERRGLLETAVRLAVSMNAFIPPPQYAALQDLSFCLGFHADALARLRARWRFEYADYARMSRPPEADRAPLRRVSPAERASMMKRLGLEGELSRAALIAAYRRMAGMNHPDRVHDRGASEREAAARRFIEITEAYEQLLGEL